MSAAMTTGERPVELPDLPPATPLEREVAERGTCRGHRNSEWWTVTSIVGSEEQMMANMAKHECKRCPVQAKCKDLADYLEGDLPDSGRNVAFLAGIWGGEGPTERANRRLFETVSREAKG